MGEDWYSLSIVISIPQIYTSADAVQVYGNFWDTKYVQEVLTHFCITSYFILGQDFLDIQYIPYTCSKKVNLHLIYRFYLKN